MKEYIHEKLDSCKNPAIEKHYNVVVVGGGLSGLCAAISSARTGAKTAIIQDRSVFGGNASSEMRMCICGASCHWGKKDASETGVIMELQLENKAINDSYNYSIWDGVLWSNALKEKNLDVYMNTTMDEVEAHNGHIENVTCYQMSTEKRFKFTSDIYIDSTGLGTLSAFAGADYRIGTEGKDEFGDKSAPDKAHGGTMGNTILFVACDTGHPVEFKKPDWAYTFDESWFVHRYHGETTVYHTADDVIVLPKGKSFDAVPGQLVEKYDVKSGYWWLELGGDWDNIIKDAEDLRWEIYKTVYGVWDHIKNGGSHGAENFELLWIGTYPGIRESRRITGDYVLTEDDIRSNRVFDDAVAFGGWPMDVHTPGGFAAKGQIPSVVMSYDGLFSIPYGCYCAKDVDNLMMTGRIISCSKVAMGATRVMGTCAVGGQAAGTAAAMASLRGESPREFGKKHIQELRQQLLKDDCYIPGVKNTDEKDLALKAVVSATSQKQKAENVINGISRNVGETINLWESDGISSKGESLFLKWDKVQKINQIRVTFDPNLSEERTITVSKSFIDREPIGVAKELVKDYMIIGYKGQDKVFEKPIKNNIHRHCITDLEKTEEVDSIEIKVISTNGIEDARIFEVRVY